MERIAETFTMFIFGLWLIFILWGLTTLLFRKQRTG